MEEALEQVTDYKTIKNIIREKLNSVVEGFVGIGYRLKQIRDEEMYKEDGYQDIWELAEKEYSLSRSSTSRFIAINEKYSIDGNSIYLLPQYSGYGWSKLSEMLSLNDEELKLISERTTRVEIREIKKIHLEEQENIEESSSCAQCAQTVQSLDFTQSEGDSDSTEIYIIPEADKLLIEFFRDKTKRAILKELAVLLSSNALSKDVIAKAAELINPSGHLMHKKGMVIMMFEEDHIKYNRMGTPTVEYTYRDFVHDLLMVFDMSDTDPWVVFYGEPEPDPEPPKKELIPEKKTTQDKPPAKPVAKKPEKPHNTQSEDEEDEGDSEEDDESEEDETEETELEEQQEEIPGQKRIEDYPELLPEDNSEEQIEEQKEEPEETVEIVEADIIETQKDTNHCVACFDVVPLMIANATIISVNSRDRVLIAKWEYLGRAREKSIEINFCPVCGKKL